MKKIVILSTLIMLAASYAQSGFITPGLERQLRHFGDDDVVKVLVVMSSQVDMRSLDWQLHSSKAPLGLRHQTVIETLRTQAQESQKHLLNDLAMHKSDGSILGFTPHWLINSVVVTGTVQRIVQLSTRPDVERVEADLVVELIKPVPNNKPVYSGRSAKSIGIAPGIAAIGARRVWDELGINGEGIIVGILDTGVSGTHPALQDRWRGNYASTEECWLDAANLGQPTPQDTHGHGTHVMGILTGLAPGDTIGVAPGALWIASNIINADDVGPEFDNGVLASLEFMTDPDGDPLTLDDVPAVVQNSWGVNESWDGYFDCDSRWWDAIDNCEAAGVVLTWSAGNEGPDEGSVRSPADRAASPSNCFSVGSTRHYEPFNISYYSSRGPSGCGGEFAMKPEIVAPGSFIYSANAYNDGYVESSGTSMAGPHVAGVVALMRASNPNLDAITIKEALMSTAVDLGDAGEDNAYGHGFLDGYAAVLAVIEGGVGTVEGYITDSGSGQPLAGASVKKEGSLQNVFTDQNGFFSLVSPSGETTFTVSKFGYSDNTLSVNIIEDSVVSGDLGLLALSSSTISGFVYGPDGIVVEDALIYAIGIPNPPTVTDASGYYELDLPAGPEIYYTLRCQALGLHYQTTEIELAGNLSLDFHLQLSFAEDFESGDFSSFLWEQGDNPWIISDDLPYEGFYCGKSGDISDNQESQLSITTVFNEADLLTFWYKVDSEANYDFFRFYIDGIEQGEWSGQEPWTQYSGEVDAGEHTFLWSYEKDSSVSIGQDAAFLDYVDFPEHAIAGPPTIELDSSFFEVTLGPEGNESQTLVVSNTGNSALNYTISLLDAGKGEASIPSWISVDPGSGIVSSGASQTISVDFDASGLAVGVYNAVMVIDSNDPHSSSLELPTTLTVSNELSGFINPLPKVVHLAGAVPNPFNPLTKISFSLPHNSHVRLNVYDISGHLIRSLLDEQMALGAHSVSWSGRDDSGKSIASGTYFMRLVAGDVVLVKSMNLVR